jgi:hypothetical protein
MRKIIFIAILFCGLYSFGQVKDSSLRRSASKVNLAPYVGKIVGQLLKNDTIKQFKGYHWTEKSPGLLYALVLEYSKSLSLVVYAKSLKYTDPHSDTKQFDFESFKKEQITDAKFIVTTIAD